MLPLKPPAPKKKLKDVKLIHFPICDQDGDVLNENEWPIFQGIFNGNVIIIKHPKDISRISNMGSFGQYGLLNKDTFVDYKTLQNQVLRQKKNWQSMELVPFEFPQNNKNYGESNSTDHQLIGESSNSNKNTTINFNQQSTFLKPSQEPTISDNIVEGTPSNWKDFKTKCSKELDELLILSGYENHNVPYFLFLEEAFFLSYTLECLEVRENGSIINALDCWMKFNRLKKDFSFFYASYHYYRSKGWVVKPGNQYGGDFVLYKLSPIYYHSSYVVVISINGQNSQLLSSWPSWFGCYRAIEAANKELLVCTVHGPEYEEGTPIDLTKYTINDTIVRRWVPSQNRNKS